MSSSASDDDKSTLWIEEFLVAENGDLEILYTKWTREYLGLDLWGPHSPKNLLDQSMINVIKLSTQDTKPGKT